MPTRHLLYQKDIPINDYIRVMIPTVGEVLENEDSYYSMVSMLTAMPIDMMVQLDDIGIDFTTINEWELFLLLFNSLKEQDTSLIFGDFDLKPFQPAINPQNGNVILVNKATEAGDGDIIDIHLDIPPICELANSNHLGLGLSR